MARKESPKEWRSFETNLATEGLNESEIFARGWESGELDWNEKMERKAFVQL